MSSSNCCFLTCIQISQEAGQVVWYSRLFQNFPQFVVIYTVKGFTARVQPRWIQGDSKVGMESASLEKYIFNYRYIQRLETDSVVGKLVEKKRLNNLVYVE